jgi:hypothetical protein
MRKSRVLLAGVAVAAAGAATSAFTNSNTFDTIDNSVAGYGSVDASGVAVTNIAYAPAANDATKLHAVTFTVDKDTTSMAARMTLISGTSTVVADVSGTGCVSDPTTITCTLTTDVLFTAFTKTGLTVTSK